MPSLSDRLCARTCAVVACGCPLTHPKVPAPLERQRAALPTHSVSFSPSTSSPLRLPVTASLYLLSFVTCSHVWHKEATTQQDASCQLAHQSIMCNFVRLTFGRVFVCVYVSTNKSNLSCLVLEKVINPLSLFLLSLPPRIFNVHVIFWCVEEVCVFADVTHCGK